ncbi:MAG: tRNA1(Val) (adenine(37)-N6)-methyltransferase [Desulfuromonadales bacterium]|nr:tRNA1(Val) (adenine(37)-N6)-methyltransferase [Desulfuromonadales bacterium]
MISNRPPDQLLLPDETLDDLHVGGVKIIQPKSGYRFSLDPLLLCALAQIPETSKVADLGTGSGVIPLLLARAGKGREFVGVELQAELAGRAERSVRLNGLSGRIKIVCADVRELPGEFVPGSFDAVVTNPPYRRQESGRVAPGVERGAARHELAGGLTDFLRAATFLLNNRGRFHIIYLAERLAELLDEMRTYRLEPKRLRLVHSRIGESAKLVLVEGRKNARPGLTVEAPLIVYREGTGRDYSEEMEKLLNQS